MRKIALTIILSLAATAGFAQTADDAHMFSENHYEGTARSIAMGNAFTALGGDLGSISINPAGSAVSGYSQLSVTPSLTFTTNVPQDYSDFTEGTMQRSQNKTSNFGLPNIGLTYNWQTGRTSAYAKEIVERSAELERLHGK